MVNRGRRSMPQQDSALGKTCLRFLFLNVGHSYAHLFLLLYPTVVLALEVELGRDYGELLLPSTAGFVAFAAGTLPAGWLGDHWSREKMMALMFLGLGAGSVATGFAAGPWELAAGLAVIGLFASIYHPVGIAMVAEETVGVGRALGINGVWGNMGVAGAPLIAGALTALWGWRAAFFVPGAVALVTGVGFVLLIRSGAHRAGRRETPPPRPAAPAVRRRVFMFVALAAVFGGLVFGTLTVALPKAVAEALDGGGAGLLSAGVMAALIFAAAAFAQIVSGRAVDRMAPRGLMLGLAGGQVLLLALLTQVAGWPVLVLAAAVMPLVFGEIPIHDAMVAHYGAAEWRARLYALKYVLSLGVSASAVPLIAWLHVAGAPGGNGFTWLYLALAIAAMVVFGASFLLPGRRG
jgi:MFS family permease